MSMRIPSTVRCSVTLRALPILGALLLTAAGDAAVPPTASKGPILPRLAPVTELVFAAGKGDHAVGIVADPDEGGWLGPADATIEDVRGRVLAIADTANGRVLLLSPDGSSPRVLPMPDKMRPWLAGAGREGWVVTVGRRSDGTNWLVWLPVQAGIVGSPSTQLPSRVLFRAIACDNNGTTYLLAGSQPNCLWRVGWRSRNVEKVVPPSASNGKYWGLSRGGDGRVYGLVRYPSRLELLRFDREGRVAKTWDLTRFLRDFESGDFIGISKLGQVLCARSISAEHPWEAPDHWGYVLCCYALSGDGVEKVGAAEIRYGPGDMEGYLIWPR